MKSILFVTLLLTLVRLGPGRRFAGDVPVGGIQRAPDELARRTASERQHEPADVVQADGTGRRAIGGELVNEPGAWTQFAGWSPDGKTAIEAVVVPGTARSAAEGYLYGQ